MNFSFIKSPAKALVPVCAALAMLTPGVQAESTYGYNAAATGPVNATAKVNLKINVPLLVLLRVGAAGTSVDEVVLGGSSTFTTDGNSVGFSWDGTVPALGSQATSTPTNLTATAWTNAPSGGSLAGAITTAMTAGGPAAADITVTHTPGSLPLAHPGANLSGLSTAVPIPKNSLRSSTWAYGLTPTALDTVAAGTYTATVTYTATTL